MLNTDTVQLSLALADSVVNEGAGNNATLGTVTRSVVTATAQKVQLARIGSPLVSVPGQVTIPANAAAVNFSIGVAADGLVTGAQQAFIVASPLNQSNVPETIGAAQVALQVLDTNGPSLNLQLADAVIPKGSNTLATLTRNTPATNALTVSLSAAPTNVISFPATVNFSLGQTSVTFTVTGVLDGLQTGNRDVVLTAAAGGFNSAARSLTVSDIYLPDLVPGIVSVPTNAYTEQQITVTWKVTNIGLGATTNQNWFDYVYLATDGLGGGQTLFAAKARVQALGVGESYTNSASFYLSALPGNFWIIVEANGNRTVTELKTANNSIFASVPLVANAAYRAELLSAAPTLAASGTPIILQGRTFNPTNNAPVPNRSASVRVLVNETRRVFSVTSDANGNFSYTFQPLANEAGDYTATADHPSLTADPAAQASFTLLGLVAEPTTVSQQLLPNTPVSGTLLLSNLTSHALNGLAFTTPNLGTNLTAQFTFTNTTLPPNGAVGVNYTLESPLTRAAQLNFAATVTSTEGATRVVPMYIKVVPTLAQLVATPSYLQRGMVRGEQAVVSFTIENTGGTASGDLIVQIPSLPWLSHGSATNLPSIPAGSNAVVTLLLNPATDLTLGLYNGNIAVFNQNVGLTIPYQFRAVSSGIGDLIINVTDDYTYYVAGEPKVTNATVVLRDPFTGGIVAQTNSGTAGVAQFSGLAEGGYTVDVSADKHNQFRGSATIAAGITNTLEAFLPRQLVTYQWSVVPTEIEDKYKIVLESVFETEVPVPNVVIEEPQVMVVVAPGKVSQFEMKLTNQGLIAANDVTVEVPYHSTYLITPLVQNVGKIPAKSSVTIPVTVQFRATASGGAVAAASGGAGGPQAADDPGCTLEDINACLPKISLRARYSYPCGGNNVSQNRSLDLSVICAGLDAQECWENLRELVGSGNLIGVGCNAINAFLACVGANLTPCQQAAISTACGAALGGVAGAVGAGAGGALECLCSHLDDIPFPSFGGGSSPAPGGDVLLPILPTGGYYACGNPVVTYIYIPGGNCSGSSPAPTATATTSTGFNPSTAPRIAAPSKANASSGVCARVRLRINQEVVMTRSAFVGTLEIENGGLSSITGVQVTLDFRDGGGTNAASKFVVEGPVLSGLTGVDGSGELMGGATGSSVYTFIPTTDAAPDQPKTYQIGGTLRYIDDGQEVVVPLLSAPITVYPEAKLDLVYFQQRDVYGDDPFTLPIEPSEPYTLGLIAKNIGAGDAKNFEITSAQPQIIENEKGLLIDFRIIGTRVGSNAISPSLTAKLGSIPAGSAKVVTWDLISTLQGKFISFEASFEHVDGLGRTNLSLINSVETHELIHAVRANRVTDDGIVDFLVNDFADPQNLPDLLYLNSGAIESVNVVTNGSFDAPAGPGHLQVQLTTTVSNGWNYFRLPDPGAGYLLASVIRSDGKVLALTNNAWTTDRSFPSSSPGAIKEHLVHLFDWAGSGQYTLTYRSTNTATPYIVQFVPVTPFTQTGAVATATIIFSEQMNLATFNYSAITLKRDAGTNLITASSGVTVTSAGGNSYTINGLTALTGVDGNYMLTVSGHNLFDVWGNNIGDTSASISWAKGNAAPVVESISAITPNPRNTPVASLLVTFSKAINPATFTLEDLALTLDGGTNLIGVGVSITTADNITFAVSGLGGLTGSEGHYAFTVNAATLIDDVGTAGMGTQSVAWEMITSAPQITALPPVSTNPRNIVVQNLDVTFSHPINPATFTFADLGTDAQRRAEPHQFQRNSDGVKCDELSHWRNQLGAGQRRELFLHCECFWHSGPRW
ncbi:MAG: CARDB domain-containing protein [Verrucomicrobiota bacterium]